MAVGYVRLTSDVAQTVGEPTQQWLELIFDRTAMGVDVDSRVLADESVAWSVDFVFNQTAIGSPPYHDRIHFTTVFATICPQAFKY